MLRHLLAVLILGATCAPVFGQGVETIWIQRIYGAGSEKAHIAIDGLDNIIVAATTYEPETPSNWNFTIVKYTPDGNILWRRSFSRAGSVSDHLNDMVVDSIGNIYMTGFSVFAGGTHSFTTIKCYPDGDTAWLRAYGPTGGLGDNGLLIAVDDSGCTYVVGNYYDNYIGHMGNITTIKYDGNGNTLWTRVFSKPGETEEEARAIKLGPIGDVYITGECEVSYPVDSTGNVITLKYSSIGNLLWSREYTGSAPWGDFGEDIAVDSQGSVYVAGHVVGARGADFATLKYYSDGDFAWGSLYDGPTIMLGNSLHSLIR